MTIGFSSIANGQKLKANTQWLKKYNCALNNFPFC